MPTALPPWPFPRWLAHRGAGREAPENTLAAFRLGAALGWPGFECDVKLSADGVPFLLHDATLDRTTSGHGRADALDWAALARLDAGCWHGAPSAGEPLPTLEAIARFCQTERRVVNLEIKPVPGTAVRTGTRVAQAAERLWADAVASGQGPWPLLSSFEPEALAAARAAAPALPRALLLAEWSPDRLGKATALGCIAVAPDHRQLTADRVAQCHAAGLRVATYTVNDADTAEQLFAWGVATVISDAVRSLGPGRAAAARR